MPHATLALLITGVLAAGGLTVAVAAMVAPDLVAPGLPWPAGAGVGVGLLIAAALLFRGRR